MELYRDIRLIPKGSTFRLAYVYLGDVDAIRQCCDLVQLKETSLHLQLIISYITRCIYLPSLSSALFLFCVSGFSSHLSLSLRIGTLHESS